MVNTTVTADINPSGTIITSITIYFTLFLIGWIVFEILQRFVYKSTYNCRKRSEETSCSETEIKYGFWGWILPVLKISDDDIFKYCGLDTLCFLRLIRLGLKLSICGIGFSALLFPLYATGTNPTENTRTEVDTLERITMSNLSENEGRIWASVVVMYFMTFLAFYLFIEEYKVYVKRRHEFLEMKGPQQYSVVIDDLPKHLRTNQLLKEYMEYVFPDQVHSVNVAVECDELEAKVAERIQTRNALEHALAEFCSTEKRPSHRILLDVGKLGDAVDSITFYDEKLRNLNFSVSGILMAIQEAEREGAQFLGGGESVRSKKGLEDLDTSASEPALDIPKFKMRLSAFVSFTTLKSAQSAQQLLQTEDPTEMEVLAAPHPKDVVWENIGRSRHERNIWQLISWVITITILLFWTVLTAFVTSLSTVDKMKEYIPPLESAFEAYPWLQDLFKQLSPLGLIAMSSLADYVFGFLSRREGHPSVTQVNASHFSKLIYFQSFQIFFASVIVGTVLDSLKEILDNPTQIVGLLGSTMPAQATTFMSYLIIQAGLNLTLEFLRVVPVAKGLIYKLAAPKLTNRERQSPWLGLRSSDEPGEFVQTDKLPDYFLAILLIFAFCALAPLLCYFAGIFLFLSDLIYRRQVLFVYDPMIFSTGVFWPKLHDYLVCALLMAQITFLGLVTLKIAPVPIIFSTILPFTTLAYYLYVNSLWPRTARNLPLSHCCRVDKDRQYEEDTTSFAFKFLNGAYVQPMLTEVAKMKPEYELSKNGNGSGDGEVQLDSISTSIRITNSSCELNNL